jgi:competence protein ComEA
MIRRHSFIGVLAIVLSLATSAVALAQDQTTPAPKKPAAPTASAPLNINTATAAQLETLPGIGPAVAARIIEYRQKNGNFKKAEELMNVKGIGEKSFLKIKALVSVAPSKTTDK